MNLDIFAYTEPGIATAYRNGRYVLKTFVRRTVLRTLRVLKYTTKPISSIFCYAETVV